MHTSKFISISWLCLLRVDLDPTTNLFINKKHIPLDPFMLPGSVPEIWPWTYSSIVNKYTPLDQFLFPGSAFWDMTLNLPLICQYYEIHTSRSIFMLPGSAFWDMTLNLPLICQYYKIHTSRSISVSWIRLLRSAITSSLASTEKGRSLQVHHMHICMC